MDYIEIITKFFVFLMVSSITSAVVYGLLEPFFGKQIMRISNNEKWLSSITVGMVLVFIFKKHLGF